MHGIATHPQMTSRLNMSCWFRGAGPISWNPLQAAKQRSCGYMRHLHLNIVPRRGTDASTMMLRIIVGPALRNQESVRWCLSHSCAPSELAVGFWKIRVPSGHGADRLSKIRQIRNQKKKSVINLASVGEHRSSCTRDNPCSLYHRVRGSLPQITDVHGCGCEASLFKYKVNCFCQLFPI